ncbi:hypothetical protein [Pseudomonas sp. F(2018)]|uniref:hypothetical protein n=1 Tax=Pseudomonas sp. F(2018) TaxID=2502240 RepID=UPI0010F999CC|nr:hypothetical protein [Pseudomonas sp. F(2018)]
MLSTETLAFLEELGRRSHSAYPEGGLLYTYLEAANQAHSRFRPCSADEQRISQPQLHALGGFLQSSQGEYTITEVKPGFVSLAEQLMQLLNQDLNFSQATWAFEDDGDSMGAKLEFARQSDNRFFSLELFWSID